ncbi:MAG: Holliday junction resolvase RuvX [Dehalococcoidales bacterium]
MRSMGLDVGDRRIGVALSDSGGILASPFDIIERADGDADVAEIVEIARQHEVAVIVVGMPRTMDGTLGPQALKVQAFADVLRRATDLPLEFRDERLSTVTAKRLVGHRRDRRGKEKLRYDDAAAAVILQSYLEELRLDPPPFPDDDGSEGEEN